MKNFTKYLNEEKGAPKELNTILTILEDARRLSQSAHWNVRGQNFLELHGLFGEIYDYANAQIDVVAERILALNNQALVKVTGNVEAVAFSNATKNIDVLIKALDTKEMTSLMSNLDETTANMIQEIITNLDKFVWKLTSSKG